MANSTVSFNEVPSIQHKYFANTAKLEIEKQQKCLEPLKLSFQKYLPKLYAEHWFTELLLLHWKKT